MISCFRITGLPMLFCHSADRASGMRLGLPFCGDSAYNQAMPASYVQIVMPPHVNGLNRLFGGQLMAWIDIAAAVEARRHTGRQVITAVVDNLSFLGPAFLDETVRLEARLTWTGKTSLEIRVDSFAEPLSGNERPINRAYLVFVALDNEGKPAPVPPFKPQGAEEREEWNRALERRERRLLSRREFQEQ